MQNRVPKRLPVPVFTPVPRRHNRVDGWTADRQRAFLDALAETGSVLHAARRINMSPEGAYALRRAPGAESFAQAWEAALDHGVQSLADLAIDRAKEGVRVPVYSYGKLVGERIVYNDRLLMFCLKHRIGRAGGEDARPLRSIAVASQNREGTRSPETRARDLAQGKEKWLEEYKEDLARFVGERAHDLADIAKALRICILREMAARDAGEIAAEDSFADTADSLCKLLSEGPDAWAAARMTLIMALPAGYQPPYPFERPPRTPRPEPKWNGGPTGHKRMRIREEAQARITRDTALFHGAATEETWKEWLARGGATGVEAGPGVEAQAAFGDPIVRRCG